MIDLFKSVNKSFFEPVFEIPVQKGQILQIACCIGQSKVAVLSEDRMLKIWDFTTGKGKFKCVMQHFFVEIPQTMAIHPHAIQIAIGLKEGIKVYYPIEDELRQIELLKNELLRREQAGEIGPLDAASAQSMTDALQAGIDLFSPVSDPGFP